MVRLNLTYSVNEIINAVTLRVAHTSNRIVDNGMTQELNYAITEEDIPMIEQLLHNSSSDVFNWISRFSKDVGDYKYGVPPIAVGVSMRIEASTPTVINLANYDNIPTGDYSYSIIVNPK